jgi:hypothetical protein
VCLDQNDRAGAQLVFADDKLVETTGQFGRQIVIKEESQAARRDSNSTASRTQSLHPFGLISSSCPNGCRQRCSFHSVPFVMMLVFILMVIFGTLLGGLFSGLHHS